MDTSLLHRSMPLCELLGMRVASASPEEVRLELDWSPTLCTSAGVLHGGVVMALADSSGAVCAFLNLPEGAGTSTIESKTNFLGAITEGATVTTTSRPLHVGSSTIVVETEVRRQDGRLVGKVTQTQAVLKR